MTTNGLATMDLVGVAEAAQLLHRDRRSVHRAVERGELQPAQKLPGLRGAYVFLRSDVEALIAERATHDPAPAEPAESTDSNH